MKCIYICINIDSQNIFLSVVAARVTDLELIYQNTLDWSPPNPPHGIILYYNIRVTTQDGVRVIEHHNDTIITTAFWSKYWNVTEGVFKVQVHIINFFNLYVCVLNMVFAMELTTVGVVIYAWIIFMRIIRVISDAHK